MSSRSERIAEYVKRMRSLNPDDDMGWAEEDLTKQFEDIERGCTQMNEQLLLKEYEDFVLKMMSKQSMKDRESIMATAGLGLAGEAGEVADTMKKLLFHEKPFTEEVRQNLILECGDVMFYLTLCATQVLGITLQEVFDRNITKLLERYKTGTFTKAEFLAKEANKAG